MISGRDYSRKGNGVVWYSRFDPEGEGGGGGSRREAQMRRMLKPLNARVFSSRTSQREAGEPGIFQRWYRRNRMRFHPSRKFWADKLMGDAAMSMHAVALNWARLLSRNPLPRLAVVTDPLFFAPLVRSLHSRKIPMVALCQNLESLGYDQLNPRFQRKLLNRELNLLSKCSLLITISREEQFVLRNLDLPALHIPYCPLPAEMERLRALRGKRAQTTKSGFLLLGTAGNKCTRDGMMAVVNEWKRIPSAKRKGEKLLVAGYWTQLMGDGIPGSGVDFLGEISDARLETLLQSVRAMICYQDHGGGALTRIPEMVVAGVPVLVNEHAARSHLELAGVICFQNLRGIVSGALKMIGDKGISVPDHQVSAPDPGPVLRYIDNILEKGGIEEKGE